MRKLIFYFTISLTVLSLAACGGKQDKAKGGMAAARGPRAMPAVTIKVPTRTVTTFKSYPTSIEGIINSEVRPKISGYITKVLVDEGQKVSKGQLLFTLETASLTQNAEAAKATVNAAQVKVDQLKPLVKQNIISQSQLETAKANLQQAKSSYQAIKAQIGYARITSPIDGFVGKIRLRKGNLVSPSSPTPLTTVSDISKVYAYFSMNEKAYLDFIQKAEGKTRTEKIKNMPKVSLVLANGETYKQKGTIDAVNSQVDKQTGSVSFRAVFDNPQRLLANGSTGVIKVPKTYKDVVVVPQKSTYERQGYTYVVIPQKTDSSTVAMAHIINVKDESGSLYIVGSGLKKGDEIVAQNVTTLRSGTPIKPMPTPFDSIAKPLPTFFK